MNLQDKVAIITGSSRGIGAAAAKLFVEYGAKVVIHYQKEKEKAEALRAELGSDNCLVVGADLTSENQVEKIIKETIEYFGKIDIVVNNAGAILRPGDWKTDVDIWHQTMDINLTSAWLMIKHAAPKMTEGGSIVNITSVYGFLGAAPVAAYTAAKGGLITLTKSMAKELAPKIRVNAVSPSNVMTDMTKNAGEELIQLFTDQTPLKRIAEPIEIAKAIAFLASDDASYITGEMLVVDGGYSLK